MQEFKGNLLGKGKNFAIIISRFNDFISNRLFTGAIDCLKRHGVVESDISVYWTPGSFEIPGVARRVREMKYDGIICLGAVIRGDTPHFEYVATEVAKGIAILNLDKGAPVVNGVVTADSTDQAIERAGTKMGNKGWDAALACLELVNLYELMKK